MELIFPILLYSLWFLAATAYLTHSLLAVAATILISILFVLKL